MSIPDDVREVIKDALEARRSLALSVQAISGESRADVLAAIDAALAWLDAQPVLPEQWELVNFSDDDMVIDEGVRVWLADSLEPDEWLHLPPGMYIVRAKEVEA